MSKHLPLNGSGITDKVRRGLSGGSGPTGSIADVLGSALAGNTSQPESSIDGTGFGLSPSHNVPATDPSQGRSGRAKPVDNRDPMLVAFQHVLGF